jgi:hypothetical protein
MRALVAVYCIVVAALMIGWWGLDIRNGALRRHDRRPAEIGLHLAAELATATLLASGAITLVVAATPGLALVALGMLLYTVVQSPGYFLARGETAPAVMCAVLLVLTVVAIVAALTL